MMSILRPCASSAAALTNEFNRIVRTVEFNGKNLLTSTSTALRIQAGFGTNGGVGFQLTEGLSRYIGTGGFQVPVEQSSGEQAGILLADVNSDGTNDQILVSGSNTLVQIGYGDGTFSSGTLYSGPYSDLDDLTLGDFNGDGIKDLVVSGYGGGINAFSIRLGAANGTFGAGVSYSMSGGYAVSAADFNGDGLLDIVTAGDGGVSGTGPGAFTTRLGRGDGTFGAAVSYSPGIGGVTDVATGDLNNDGIQDLVVTGGSTSRSAIYLGTGSGSFTFHSTFVDPGQTRSVSMADYNGDGNLDVFNSGGFTGFGGLYAAVRLGNGDGTFARPITFTGSLYTFAAADFTGDINGDGHLDIAIAGATDRFVIIGNGDGTFRAMISTSTISLGATVGAFTMGDTNGDDVLDFALSTDEANIGQAQTTQTTDIGYLNITSRAGGLAAVAIIDKTLRRIAIERGNIGATENRLGTALNTLSIGRENYDEAASRIVDADVAQEAAGLVRSKILQQASAAVLAQANQQPGLALTLLRNAS